MSDREILVVAHPTRIATTHTVTDAIRALTDAGVRVRVLADEYDDQAAGDVVAVTAEEAAEGTELTLVFGGDGTLLRAAELARPAGVPLLGVNLGRVGFLAEAERDDLADTIEHVLARDYQVEQRLTLGLTVYCEGQPVTTGWALNDVSVEKASRKRMLDLVLEVDGRPLSRWGGDGVVCATPTGSTAYAFSAGGPVVWPQVEALVVVPISAHALFARPLVLAPSSVLAVEVLHHTGDAVAWCDGRRTIELTPGARVEIRRGDLPVKVARLHDAPFTDRLVEKFGLPVQGWRGHVD